MYTSELFAKYPEYRAVILAECPCGAELRLNPSLTALYCDNPDCTETLGARLNLMVKSLGIKGFGEAICNNIVEKHQLKKLQDVFLVEPAELTDNYLAAKNIELFNKLLNITVPLAKAVSSYILPGIQSQADKIFDGYSDIDSFFQDLQNDSAFILKRINPKAAADGYDDTFKLNAPAIRETLLANQQNLREYLAYFTIKQVPKVSLQVAITGEVANWSNKDLFIQELNKHATVNIIRKDTVTRDTAVLVNDGSASSSKAKKAVDINAKKKPGETPIIITNSLGLIDYLVEKDHLNPETAHTIKNR